MVNNPLYEEKDLLARIAEGDREAFDRVYRQYWADLYESACKRLEDKTLAEDLVQEVFLRLWNKRTELKVENLAAYLHSAVRYQVINYVSRNRAPIGFYEPFEALFLEKEWPDSKINVRELILLIAHYAESLPEKRKQIFLKHINEKLSTREIAEYFKVSQKTVQNQLNTALKGLRSRINRSFLLPILLPF